MNIDKPSFHNELLFKISPTLDYSLYITDVGLLQHISPDNVLCNITEESIACYTVWGNQQGIRMRCDIILEKWSHELHNLWWHTFVAELSEYIYQNSGRIDQLFQFTNITDNPCNIGTNLFYCSQLFAAWDLITEHELHTTPTHSGIQTIIINH